MTPRLPRAVVVVASTAYYGHQLYDQRLARALAATGRETVYVDPSRPLVSKSRRSAALPNAQDQVRVLTPWTLPWGRRRLLAPLTAILRGVAIRWSIRDLPQPRAFIVTAAHPLTVRLLGRGRKSYLLKDDYAAGAALIGVSRAVVERRRRKLLRSVDAIAVVSPALADATEAMGARSRAVVIPPGCAVAAVADGRSGRLSSIPQAAFIGMVSDRLDFDLLDAVAAAGFDIVVAGRRQVTFKKHSRLANLIDTGSLTMLGELPEASVANLVATCDLALLPYTDSDFNRASFPLKLLEYLAVGRPVVATALPAVQWLNAPHVYTVTRPEDVAAALDAALEASRDPRTARQCREFAARHTWAHRAEEHLRLVAWH